MKILFRVTLVLAVMTLVASVAEAFPGLNWIHRTHERRVERGVNVFGGPGGYGAGCSGTVQRAGCQGSVGKTGCQGVVNLIVPTPSVPMVMPAGDPKKK